MVVNNAEVIGGVIAHQLLAPGARTFYASAVTTMDLWSGAANCGGPEDLVFQMANAQLARAYGLKSMVGTFATGSKTSDWQGGVENALSGLRELDQRRRHGERRGPAVRRPRVQRRTVRAGRRGLGPDLLDVGGHSRAGTRSRSRST